MQFLSTGVVSAFTSAAAITIASGQLKSLLGLTSGRSNEFIPAWRNVFEHIDETRPWDAVLGIICIMLLITLKVRLSLRFQLISFF